MISAKFTAGGGRITGCTVEGHAQYAEKGQDIVCSAVSAVSIMTANTVTEVLRAAAGVKTGDGYLEIRLKENNAEAENLLEGLRLFLEGLSKQYPEYVRVSITNRKERA